MQTSIVKNSPSFEVGGRVFTDFSKLVVLLGACGGSGAVVRGSSARLAMGSSGYQVPAGKVLKVWAASYYLTGASTGAFNLGYSDNDVGFEVDSPSYTNGVFGTTTIGDGAANLNKIIPLGIDIPAGKYFGIRAPANTNISCRALFYCTLEDAA